MIQPQIVEKPAMIVVGLEEPFISALSPDKTNSQVIGPLWHRFMPRTREVLNQIGGAGVGVIYGRPESERAHPHELQYIAAVPVSAAAAVPDGMVSRTVAAGTFAVFTHRGPIQELEKTVHDIYRVWLPQSAYRHADVADVELYDQRFRGDSPDSEMEYWISVTPKGNA